MLDDALSGDELFSYSSEEMIRIAGTIADCELQTEEQAELLEALKYRGSMNVRDVIVFLEEAVKIVKHKEDEHLRTLQSNVSGMLDVLSRFKCPHCGGTLEVYKTSMTLFCLSCSNRISYQDVRQVGWFPKRISVEETE